MNDKTYNVRQISQMLQVSTETVRRWIRYGIIEGLLDNGKKGGYLVTEKELNRFLKNRPKYNKKIISDTSSNKYNTLSLNQRIFELDDLIRKLQETLEELKEIRDLLS